ncbi:MAG: PadR family transcriptional regulator [Enterobacteriaceae bacterium]
MDSKHCQHGRHHRKHEHCGQQHHGQGRRMKLHRLFEHGDLRFVLLALLDRQSSHGYELIKAIEKASSGLYTPSPGVIYPNLTFLEEQGLIQSVDSEKGRRSLQITTAGKEQLEENQSAVDAIFEKLAQVGTGQHGSLASDIEEAIHRLKKLLRHNLVNRQLSTQQISAIAATLNEAVQQIEEEIQRDDESDI